MCECVSCFFCWGGSCSGACDCCVCLLLLMRVVLAFAVCCRFDCFVLFGVVVVALLSCCDVCVVSAAASFRCFWCFC